MTHSPIRFVSAAVRRAIPQRRRGNVILMYHRIASTDVDPWALCVDPATFSGQMKVLKTVATPVSLDELPELSPGHPAVAITFDDGYVDNLENALPILQEHGIPATIFVSTGYIGATAGYWWDQIEAIFLSPGVLPSADLKLCIDGRNHHWSISGADLEYEPRDCASHRGWIAWQDPPPTSRHAAFYQIWSVLRQVKAEQRQEGIRTIHEWAGLSDHAAAARCMTTDELCEISREPLVRIGSHTVTHSRLSELSESSQWNEIAQSKVTLEQILERPVDSFSYPFGDHTDYSSQTVRSVRRAGYQLACSNFEGVVGPKSNRFQLPRLHVRNWSGGEFETWLGSYLKS